MDDNMSMDDMSFADLLDTSQAHLKRPRIEPALSPGQSGWERQIEILNHLF